MVFLEVAVILLIVTNAAASTVTREREDGTLDLLLSTPITSRYYIWGKLRGLVSFSLPLIVVPTASCAVFVLYDAFRFGTGAGGQWMVLPEAILLVPALLLVLVAFASIVGMRMSLSTKTTVKSVMASLAIVVGLFAVLGWCGTQIATSTGSEVGLVFAAFSPLTVIMLLIDPAQFGGAAFVQDDATRQATARVIVLLFGPGRLRRVRGGGVGALQVDGEELRHDDPPATAVRRWLTTEARRARSPERREGCC